MADSKTYTEKTVLNQKSLNLESQQKQLISEENNLKKQLEDNKKKLKEVDDKIKISKAQEKLLKEKHLSETSKMSKLKLENKNNQDKIKTDINTLKDELNKLNVEIAENKNDKKKVKELEEKKAELKKQIASKESQLEKLKFEYADIEHQAAELGQRQIDEINKLLSEEGININEKEKLKQENENILIKINDTTKKIYTIEEEKNIVQKKLKDVDSDLKYIHNYSVGDYKSKVHNELNYDLRNLNGANFRNNNNIIDESKLNYFKSLSKQYIMNRDFLVIDTLSLKSTTESMETPYMSEIVCGMAENLKNRVNIQPLILNEFQPYDMLSPADLMPGGLLAKAGEAVQKAAEAIGGTALIALGKNVLMKNNVDKYSKDPSLLYNPTSQNLKRTRRYLTSDPVQVVQNMFNGGKWLNTYQIPYYGNDYLMSNFKGNWQLAGSEGFLGSLAGKNGKEEVGKAPSIGTKGFGIDFPGNPKFTPSMNSGRTIKTNFYLVNSNTEWLVRNFQFIQAFFSGASWLHMKYCQIRPPNVYHVLCPGRFQIYWAAIDVSVTFEGKLRKNVEAVKRIKELTKWTWKKTTDETSNGIKSIDEDMLWPEAWKVDVHILDLTPNNFNLYAEYYAHGFKWHEVKDLEEQISAKQVFSEIEEYFKELINQLTESITTGVKNVYKGITGKEYKEGQSLADTAKDLATGFKTNIGRPIAQAMGVDKVTNEYEAAYDEYNKLLKEYDEPGVTMYDDPRSDAIIERFIRANAAKLKQENLAKGMSEEEAEKAANRRAISRHTGSNSSTVERWAASYNMKI